MSDGNRFEIVVVGGGLSGLAAAAILGKAGLKVLLLEKSRHIGGRATTMMRDDGFFLNLGPHALYQKGAAAKVLRELGVKFSGGRPPSKGFAVRGRQKFVLPGDFFSLLTTSLLSWRGKLEAARTLTALPKIDTNDLNAITFQQWLDQNLKESETKQLLAAIARLATYQNAPELMSAGAALRQIGLALTGGVLYLDGGWQTIVDSLRAVAKKVGVQILSETNVTTIATNGNGSVIQSASGAEYQADFVVLAVAADMAAQLIGSDYETTLNRSAKKLISVKAACLDVALQSLPEPNALFALGMDEAFYFSVHSTAAQLAPRGGAVVHLMKYLRHDQPRDAMLDRRDLEELFDLIQPGWRERIIFQRFLPQMVVSNALVTAETGGTRGRISPNIPDQPRVYVAGDWVGAEGLLADAALSSAKQAAEMIIKAARGETFLACYKSQTAQV